MRCYAFAYSSSFTKREIKEYLEKNYQAVDYEGVFHIKKSAGDDVFVFPFGAFVCFGTDEHQEEAFKKEFSKHLNTPSKSVDDDLYHFDVGANARVKEDHITLPNDDIMTKLACAHSLAQSAKLGAFEEAIAGLVDDTKNIPIELAKKGAISLSRKRTRQLLGRIFYERSLINLHLELLDSPNFFWDHPEYEPIYEMMIKDLNLTHRVTVLNQRLGVMHELFDMLTTELNNQHSSFLEWIIIILIAIEILLMLVKEIFHFI